MKRQARVTKIPGCSQQGSQAMDAQQRGDTLPKQNYGYEKRQRELLKQKKRDAKREAKKLEKSKAGLAVNPDQPANEADPT